MPRMSSTPVAGGSTVTVVVSNALGSATDVALINAWPSATPVTTPVLASTVAIASASDVHVTRPSAAPRTVAVSCTVPFTGTAGFSGAISTVTTGRTSTSPSQPASASASTVSAAPGPTMPPQRVGLIVYSSWISTGDRRGRGPARPGEPNPSPGIPAGSSRACTAPRPL